MTSPADVAREYLEAWNRRDWETFGGVLDDQYTGYICRYRDL